MVLVSSARAWLSTIGSLSTYTTRASGSTDWATWCVLSAVGMPVPMSRNWRTPACAMYRTERPRNRRLARTPGTMVGVAAIARSAASRSEAKLSLPPSQ